jgi:hypothetical protein
MHISIELNTGLVPCLPQQSNTSHSHPHNIVEGKTFFSYELKHELAGGLVPQAQNQMKHRESDQIEEARKHSREEAPRPQL